MIKLISRDTVSIAPVLIEEFEALIGTALPGEYREFLIKTGGNINPNSIAETPCGKPGDLASQAEFHRVELEHLASIVPNERGESELMRHYRYMNGPERENNWLPDDMIVIGNSGGGGRCFLIAIKGLHRGQIFFWDINLFPQDDNVPVNYDNISFVALSFDAFLEGIEEHGQ